MMRDLVRAFMRSLATLAQPKVWFFFLGPFAAALLIWTMLSVFALDQLIDALTEQPPMLWLSARRLSWLASSIAHLGGYVLVLAAATLTALVLTAIFVVPLMVDHVAKHSYPDVARLGRDSFTASTWNSISALLLYCVGFATTLPLWLIPGAALVLPIFWMAWLIRRTFAYDSLAVHATDDEWRVLNQKHSFPFLSLGAIQAPIAHIPWVGLLAAPFAALIYVHYGLEALRQLRGESVRED